MAGPYIPASDSAFDAWASNFSTLVTADPIQYGEDAGSALIVQNAFDAWSVAYQLTLDPATRTTPAIVEKDSLRVVLTSAARPMAMRINANAIVTNQQRADLGITVRKTTQTPIPPPATAPSLSLVSATAGQHTLAYGDASTPDSKAKPFGVTSLQLFSVVGDVAAVDPLSAAYDSGRTKSPLNVSNLAANSGKVKTYFARWVTTSGPTGEEQPGPWSLPLSVVII